jgi:tetratricopeptide (TPR) repeat protein
MFSLAASTERSSNTSVKDMIDQTHEGLLDIHKRNASENTEKIIALSDLYLHAAGATGDARYLLETAISMGFGRSDKIATARLQLQMAVVDARAGEYAKVRQLLNEAKTVWQSNPDQFLREISLTNELEASVLWNGSQRGKAIERMIANLPNAQKTYLADDWSIAWYYQRLGMFLTEEQRFSEASDYLRQGRAFLARQGKGKSDAALLVRRFEADVASQNGETDVAVSILQTVIADRKAMHGPTTALPIDLLHLGRQLTKQGRPGAAFPVLAEAAPLSIKFYGADSEPTFKLRLAQVDALAELSRFSEARDTLALAEKYARSKGVNNANYGLYLGTRSHLIMREGKLNEAEADLNKAETLIASHADEPQKQLRAIEDTRRKLNLARRKENQRAAPISR